VISAAGAEPEAELVLDWAEAPPDEDGVLAVLDVVLPGAEAALELLLLLPQPAITTAVAIGTRAASRFLCTGAPPIDFGVRHPKTTCPPPHSFPAGQSRCSRVS
jgi:hypothetical protein